MRKTTLALTCAAALALAACSGKADITPAEQAGADPTLPAPQNFLLPPMKVPRYVGWQDGEAPAVADGLKIEKIASGLMHPRQLLTLPNGDVLVVESNSPGAEAITTFKQLVAGKVKAMSGKGAEGGNRITLLRRTPSGEWEQHVSWRG